MSHLSTLAAVRRLESFSDEAMEISFNGRFRRMGTMNKGDGAFSPDNDVYPGLLSGCAVALSFKIELTYIYA